MVMQETIRTGSKVFFADTMFEPVTVLANENGDISIMVKNLVKATPEDLFPVPLNEDTITRCGFFKTDTYVFEHPVERIELEIDHDSIVCMHVHNHQTTVKLSSLHELQHAFWTYTNKELEFK